MCLVKWTKEPWLKECLGLGTACALKKTLKSLCITILLCLQDTVATAYLLDTFQSHVSHTPGQWWSPTSRAATACCSPMACTFRWGRGGREALALLPGKWQGGLLLPCFLSHPMFVISGCTWVLLCHRKLGSPSLLCPEVWWWGTSSMMRKTWVQILWGHGQLSLMKDSHHLLLITWLWLLWLPHNVLNGASFALWGFWLTRGLWGLLVASTSCGMPVKSLSSHWGMGGFRGLNSA